MQTIFFTSQKLNKIIKPKKLQLPILVDGGVLMKLLINSNQIM